MEITLEQFIEVLQGGARAVLMVRHAERPKLNPDDPSFGDGVKLTEEGSRTARVLGEKLAAFRDDVQFCTSPLTRTRMTAELIAAGMGVASPDIADEPKFGNSAFYYDDPLVVLDVFRPENFFPACFSYFATGEQRGFKNLYAASDECEAWLTAHWRKQLFVVTTHDCYIAAFLSARKAMPPFTRENWPRFLDGGAIIERPDGTREYALVRTGLSTGICGVRNKS